MNGSDPQPGVIPAAGTVQTDPNTGQVTHIFDPNMGQEGEFVPVPVTPDPLPSVGPEQAAQPELTPEQIHGRNLRAILERDFVDPATGQIRQELIGGDLPSIEEIRNQDLTSLSTTIEGLKSRKSGRQIGFAGEFTDVAGGQAYDNFKTSVGAKEDYFDAYGMPTALGTQAQLAETPVQPTGTVLELDRLQSKPEEFLDSTTYDLGTAPTVSAQTGQVASFQLPTKTGPTSFSAAQSFDKVTDEDMLAAKQQGLTDKVQAQTGTVERQATVQGQLESLMTQFEDNKIPAWAAGAIRTAEQRLASRGMGASSMAGAAIVQAAMEAATPIAAADAQTYRNKQKLLMLR